MPILIGADSRRAFDLFQSEDSDFTGIEEIDSFAAESAPAMVPTAEEAFAQLKKALDAPRPATELNLPLGGIAPTDREVASARALIVGWIAACGMAAFAFLSQGPTLTSRLADTSPPEAVVDAPPPARTSDIRLDPAAAPKPAPPAKKQPRPPASPAPTDKP